MYEVVPTAGLTETVAPFTTPLSVKTLVPSV